ncbi:MAG: signal peptide peptidase SppA [Bacteroidales bacterium]|nr:signal peptide peptidase SppA [Bacteroidales bacterium]
MKKYILTLALLAFAFAGAWGAEEGFLKGKILKIDKDVIITERGGNSLTLTLNGLNRESSIALIDVLRALDKAASDDAIAMVYLNYDHFSASQTSMEEIRERLLKLSALGKPVIAYGASLGNGSYYIASAADRVFLNPKGGGALTGLASTQFFLKDLLDTLGVGVQLIRHGKFKSAGEMYIRNDISPENRLQYEELLGSVWNAMVADIAASRGTTPEAINAITDKLETGTAQAWLEAGLVDGLKYRDEMEDYLCHLFGTDDPKSIQTVSLKDYASKLKKGPASKKIAIIYAEGEIARSGSDLVGEKLAAQIEKVRKDESVKAVVFRVNSPGGEVVAADIIRREIELLGKEKPVVASYGSYAASGGYLISAGCEHIFTDATTLTGSIGVFGMIPNLGKAIRKNLKITPVNIGTNDHSSMGSGMEPLSAEEEAWYQAEIEGIYDDFVGVVAAGRNMTAEQVDSIAQGRVWAGNDAIEIGLCDEKGGLMDAIRYAAAKAGLLNYRIVAIPEKEKTSLRSLTKGNKDDKDDPLVSLREMLETPGFNAYYLMPYIILN